MSINSRFRFSIFDDLLILKEVLAQNPYAVTSRWEDIQETFFHATGRSCSVRSIKEHIHHLLKLYVKEDRSNLRKSGCEEQYIEKEQLLQEVKELFDETKAKYLKSKSTRGVVSVPTNGNLIKVEPIDDSNDQQDKSFIIPDVSLEDCDSETDGMVFMESEQTSQLFCNAQDSIESLPEHQRRLKRELLFKSQSLDSVRKKRTLDRDIRLRELDLEERWLKLEEEKLELEKKKVEISCEEQKSNAELARKRLASEEKVRLEKLRCEEVRMIEMKTMFDANVKVLTRLVDFVSKRSDNKECEL